MRQLIAVLVLVLFLLACEPVEEDDRVREAEERADVLGEQLAALTEQLQRIEEKLEEKPVETPVAEEIEEALPENVTEEVTVSSVVLSTNATVPPAPIIFTNETDELTEEIRAILQKADDTVKSYSFLYSLPPSHVSGSMVSIKGSKMKIKLKDTRVYNHENYMDTIYVDFDANTAYGYCEDAPIAACSNRSKKTVLPFLDYNIKTPYQWLKEITAARKMANVLLWDRHADVLEHTQNQTKYTYWIDVFSGLPVRININEPNKETVFYEFRYLSVNHLKDSDVVK